MRRMPIMETRTVVLLVALAVGLGIAVDELFVVAQILALAACVYVMVSVIQDRNNAFNTAALISGAGQTITLSGEGGVVLTSCPIVAVQKIGGDSQSAQKTIPLLREIIATKSNSTLKKTVNIRLALLLTHDPDFEKTVTAALKETGAEILVTHDVDHALEMACQRAAELDLAIIDRSDCHAITLLSAVKTLHHDLPVVVITSGDTCHCAALAYANGADACLAKPITAADLKTVLRQLCEPKLELTEV